MSHGPTTHPAGTTASRRYPDTRLQKGYPPRPSGDKTGGGYTFGRSMRNNPRVELIAELGSGAREVSRARRALAASLERWGWNGDAADVAILLTSELVTNAIKHGSGPVKLSAGLDGERVLRVEVRDHTAAGIQVREAEDDDEDGRGLQLVDVLAHAWGWQPGGDGKHVWFELGPA